MTEVKITDRIQYFNDLGSRWDETVGNDDARRARIAEIFGKLSIKHGDRVLDAGTGNGVLLPFIEDRIGPEGGILALDPAEAMLERARTLYSRFSNIDYLVSSLEDAALPAAHFNAILCFAVVPHLHDMSRAIRNLRSAIRDDGTLYIFHLNDTASLNEFHRSLNAPVKHDMLPDESGLRALLSEAGFHVICYIDRPGLNFVECQP